VYFGMGRWSLLIGMLLVFFGLGLAVNSLRGLMDGEGKYDRDSARSTNVASLVGLLAGLAMLIGGGWLLWQIVPEYVMW